jgi:hypothetical protein
MINIKFKPTIVLTALFIGFLTLWESSGTKELIKQLLWLCLNTGFLYNHIDFITQESTVPDLRKSVLKDKAENPRHYFDMENFGSIDSFPQSMTEAKRNMMIIFV